MRGPKTRPSLLQRVKDRGDTEAWQDFDARYGGLILSYCRRRGLQPADAEDVRQLVLLSLSRFLPRFDYDPGRGGFRRYLGRIVHRSVARYCKAKHRSDTRLHTGDLARLADAGSDAESVWREEWTNHHFRLAFEAVRAHHTPRVLEMFGRLLAGRSPAQVASEFGTTAQAVHKVKQRIRDQLNARIAEQIAEEDRSRG